MDHTNNIYLIITNTDNSKYKKKTTASTNNIMIFKKRKRIRKKLNIKKTLENYKERILNGPLRDQLHTLADSYLSTFQVFSTETQPRKKPTNNAFVLMSICLEMGIPIRGVTSECKIKNKYRASLVNNDTRENSKIVYVDSYNYFTKHNESIWSIKREDKCYYS